MMQKTWPELWNPGIKTEFILLCAMSWNRILYDKNITTVQKHVFQVAVIVTIISNIFKFLKKIYLNFNIKNNIFSLNKVTFCCAAI